MFTPNEKDRKYFKMLSESEMGIWLIEYIDRLSAHLCDLRNIDESKPERITAAKMAVGILSDELIDRVKMQNKIPGKNNRTYK